ncbi:MAG: hypothetical protein MJZ37_04345 [Bacilli bacterium]|nr:hypothetical protein [Bacilli bacterium]
MKKSFFVVIFLLFLSSCSFFKNRKDCVFVCGTFTNSVIEDLTTHSTIFDYKCTLEISSINESEFSESNNINVLKDSRSPEGPFFKIVLHMFDLNFNNDSVLNFYYLKEDDPNILSEPISYVDNGGNYVVPHFQMNNSSNSIIYNIKYDNFYITFYGE